MDPYQIGVLYKPKRKESIMKVAKKFDINPQYIQEN